MIWFDLIKAVKTRLKTNEMPFLLVLLLTLSFTLNFFCGLGTLTSILKFDISQGSVVTRFNCTENFNYWFISIFRISWWKNFENRSMFDEVIITLKGGRLFATTCRISHYKQWVLNWVALRMVTQLNTGRLYGSCESTIIYVLRYFLLFSDRVYRP